VSPTDVRLAQPPYFDTVTLILGRYVTHEVLDDARIEVLAPYRQERFRLVGRASNEKRI
jgi:hypothetical protein